ncbi:MAG: TetR/AcrR family transcriptional regulator [Steroidobacteraceae bacterium]
MERKAELSGKALDYCLKHGVADLSLRPLARAIGSSARLLIYHFGSKDGLLSAVMDEVRQRAQRSFTESMAEAGQSGVLQQFWTWATAPKNSRYVRLLFEVQTLSLHNPGVYGHLLEGNSVSWLTLIESALPLAPDRRAKATLCAAVIDGLLLELLNTGDLKRTSEALELFGSLLSAGTRTPARRPLSRLPREE